MSFPLKVSILSCLLVSITGVVTAAETSALDALRGTYKGEMEIFAGRPKKLDVAFTIIGIDSEKRTAKVRLSCRECGIDKQLADDCTLSNRDDGTEIECRAGSWNGKFSVTVDKVSASGYNKVGRPFSFRNVIKVQPENNQ